MFSLKPPLFAQPLFLTQKVVPDVLDFTRFSVFRTRCGCLRRSCLIVFPPQGCDARVMSVEVFKPWEGGFPCIRVPSIIRTPHALIAFAECRMITGDDCNRSLCTKLESGFDSVGLMDSDNTMYVCQKKSTERRQNVGTPHVPLRSYRGQSRGISCLRRGPSQADRCGQPHEPAAHHGTFPPLPFTQTTSDDEGDSYSPMENIDAKVGAAHTTSRRRGPRSPAALRSSRWSSGSLSPSFSRSCSSATTTATNTIPSGSPTTRASPGLPARRCCGRWTRRNWWRWETAT